MYDFASSKAVDLGSAGMAAKLHRAQLVRYLKVYNTVLMAAFAFCLQLVVL